MQNTRHMAELAQLCLQLSLFSFTNQCIKFLMVVAQLLGKFLDRPKYPPVLLGILRYSFEPQHFRVFKDYARGATGRGLQQPSLSPTHHLHS